MNSKGKAAAERRKADAAARREVKASLASKGIVFKRRKSAAKKGGA